MINKLENPLRVEELNPKKTLERIGLIPKDIFCDFGAGTGIFTFAAEEITDSIVYAVEISDAMLEALNDKKRRLDKKNICIVKDLESIQDKSCDIILFCTVLHELAPKNMAAVLNSVKRVLSDRGRLAIIEFHKRATAYGPPPEYRIDSLQAEESLLGFGFSIADKFDLGDNFYCLTFSKNRT